MSSLKNSIPKKNELTTGPKGSSFTEKEQKFIDGLNSAKNYATYKKNYDGLLKSLRKTYKDNQLVANKMRAAGIDDDQVKKETGLSIIPEKRDYNVNGYADYQFVNDLEWDILNAGYEGKNFNMVWNDGLQTNSQMVKDINKHLRTISNKNDREATVQVLSSHLDSGVFDDAGVTIYDKKSGTIAYDVGMSKVRKLKDDNIDDYDKAYGNKPGTKDYYVWGEKVDWSPSRTRQQVKAMKASGKTNAEIADALGITDVSYYLYD